LLSSESGQEVGNGSYSVKMRLRLDISQFLPMFGKHIRVYYHGITKKCTNYFGPHARKVCNPEKLTLIEYISHLMTERPNIAEEFYGK
jgi:hypothetical protein